MKKDSNHFETLGIVTKEVTFTTVKHNIVPNTLVLETLQPFPGYHGENLPTDTKPEAVYLVLSKEFSTEFIYRTVKKIRRFINFPLDAIPGEAVIYNDHYYAIRIRNLEKYELLQDLQQWFIDEGLTPMKSKNIEANGLIRLKKLFLLENMTNSIFKDLEDKHMYYVEIPMEVSWSLFRKITYNVKNNIDNRNFDAARTYMYLNGITDFVRIYAKNPSLERLEDIKNRYNDEMRRYI